MANNQITTINAAVRKVSNSANQKKDMELLMAPYADWDEFLIPAPLTVAILGNLILVSAGTEFSLADTPPKNGFQLISRPSSFRATLSQVSHAGWDAFNMSDRAMDQIRLHASGVPEHLKEAVTILMKGDVKEVEDFLPVPLGAIQNVADHCLKLATGIEAEFVKVMHLTAEVLEACVGTQGKHENDMREVAATLKALEQQKIALTEEKEMNKALVEKIAKSVIDAESQYNAAVNDIPAGWGLIGMAAAEGVIESAKGAMNALTFGNMRGAVVGILKGNNDANVGGIDTNLQISKADEDSYKQAQNIHQHLVTLQNVVQDVNLKQMSQGAADIKCHQESIIGAQVNLNGIRKRLMHVKGAHVAAAKAISICKKGVTISERLNAMVNKWEHDTKALEDLQVNVDAVFEEALVFSMEANYALSNLPFSGNPPCMTQSKNICEDKNHSVVAQSQVKAQMASAHLNHTREVQDRKMDKLKESNRELGEVLGKMEKLDLQKIDFITIKKTLKEGILAISELRIQWSKLVKFFQMMANLIECSLNKSLKKFLEYSKKNEERILEGYPISDLMRDLVYMQAFQGASIAHLVHMLSESYCEISKKYVMPRISGLDKLFAFDVEKDKAEIEGKRTELFRGCKEAQRAIGELLDKKKRDYDIGLDKRLKQIETELLAVMPPPMPSIQAITKRAIESGTTTGIQLEPPPTGGLCVDDFW